MAHERAVEMFVGGLVLDPATQAPIVVLKDETGQITLPIWIGKAEATSIASALKQVNMARPLTHDLMYDMLLDFNVTIERVVITELKDSTYYAELVLMQGDKAFILDARPSDAIAMALRGSSPIYVSEQVLDQSRNAMAQFPAAGSAPPEAEEESPEVDDNDEPALDASQDLNSLDKEKLKDLLSELDPEDFKYKM